MSAAVLRQGPIPQFVHGIIEYLAAVLFIAAPFILIFEDGTVTSTLRAVLALRIAVKKSAMGSVCIILQMR